MKKEKTPKKPYKSVLSNTLRSWGEMLRHAPAAFLSELAVSVIAVGTTMIGLYLPSVVVREASDGFSLRHAVTAVGGLVLLGQLLGVVSMFIGQFKYTVGQKYRNQPSNFRLEKTLRSNLSSLASGRESRYNGISSNGTGGGNMKLNENIAALRKKKGLTQEELARVFGVTNQAVSKWESAQSCPDVALLPEIAAFFGVSVDTLMGVEPSLAEVRGAILGYTGETWYGTDRGWDVMAAAVSALSYSFNRHFKEYAREEIETMEGMIRGLTEKPDTWDGTLWLLSEKLSAYCFPPVMLFFRMPEEGYGIGEERAARISSFCRCFADPDNVKIAGTLCRDIRKSAVEVSVETGMDAEFVRGRLEGEMEPFVVKRYDCGLSRWQIFPWVMPLLFFLSHPGHDGLKERQK